jgi:hypothetical protein
LAGFLGLLVEMVQLRYGKRGAVCDFQDGSSFQIDLSLYYYRKFFQIFKSLHKQVGNRKQTQPMHKKIHTRLYAAGVQWAYSQSFWFNLQVKGESV